MVHNNNSREANNQNNHNAIYVIRRILQDNECFDMKLTPNGRYVEVTVTNREGGNVVWQTLAHNAYVTKNNNNETTINAFVSE